MFNRIFAKLRKYKEKVVSSLPSFVCIFPNNIVHFHSNPTKKIFFSPKYLSISCSLRVRLVLVACFISGTWLSNFLSYKIISHKNVYYFFLL